MISRTSRASVANIIMNCPSCFPVRLSVSLAANPQENKHINLTRYKILIAPYIKSTDLAPNSLRKKNQKLPADKCFYVLFCVFMCYN